MRDVLVFNPLYLCWDLLGYWGKQWARILPFKTCFVHALLT